MIGYSKVDHGCCAGGRHVRRHCGCNCHDCETFDQSAYAPSKAYWHRKRLQWVIYRDYRLVGTVLELLPEDRLRVRGHGYAAHGAGAGVLAVVDDPFTAASILWTWTIQGGWHAETG